MSVGLQRVLYYYYFQPLSPFTSPSDWRLIRYELYRSNGMRQGEDIKRLFISFQSGRFLSGLAVSILAEDDVFGGLRGCTRNVRAKRVMPPPKQI
jgi:hypothetical protein